jgi:valyl-tRNA synthetase
LERFYPTNVLVTGFDIIFFWVARMMMMGLHLKHQVPFGEVYIHALVRDEKGAKMSKSKGNVMDPLDIVDGVTLDALIAKRVETIQSKPEAAKVAADTKKEFPKGFRRWASTRFDSSSRRWPRRGATSSFRFPGSRVIAISRPKSGTPRASLK